MSSEEAVGKRIVEIAAGDDDQDVYRTVIGVLKDFHFESLHQAIRPLALNIDPDAVFASRPGSVRRT